MIKISSIITIIVSSILLASCTKDIPKELLDKQNQQNKQQSTNQDQQQMPNDSIHRNLSKNNSGDTKGTDTQSDTKGDAKAEEMVKDADNADAQFQKTKSEADKKQCITKQMAAANYLMFEANLSPKKKYRPALQRYNRVLELDPSNKEAMANKKQIEDIYQSMGMPVPN